MAVIGVEPAVKYSFVLKGMQTRRKGQYNTELTLSPRLYVKPLITPITTIDWVQRTLARKNVLGSSAVRYRQTSPILSQTCLNINHLTLAKVK